MAGKGKGRAAPMTPDARRASVIAAALPLIRRYGKDVTTAQIAMAAGVAEGTLFRAFPDKDAIIRAALETAFDPAPTIRELRAIELAQPLRTKLIDAVEIMTRRVEHIWQMMSMLAMSVPVPERRPPPNSAPPGLSDQGIKDAMLALFVGHEAELRVSPELAMRAFRMFSFAATHPRIADGEPLASPEVVSLMLDGLRVRDDRDEESEP